MTRELDRQVAAALGWTVRSWIGPNTGVSYSILVDPHSVSLMSYDTTIVFDTEDSAWACVPRFSEDISATTPLEEEIARRGLQEQYIEALCLAIDDDTSSTGLLGRYRHDRLYAEHLWRLVTAGAGERARAFVAAFGEQHAA